MMSPSQRTAIRTFVAAALELDDNGAALVHPNAAYPRVLADAIGWDDEDPPRAVDGPRIVLSIVGSDERAPTEASDIAVLGVLETRYREQLDVTVGIRCYSRRSTTSPSHSQDADQILRRIWSRVHSENLSIPLQAVGVATTRRGSIAALPRIARGSQWETGASFFVVCRTSPTVVERPGHIESAAGTGTLDPLAPLTFTADAVS